MPLSSIYAVTDRTLLSGTRLHEGVEAALRGGIRTVQLRDKVTSLNRLRVIARELAVLCCDYQAKLIINDRVDLAQQCAAHGVHLGQGDGSVREARQRLGPTAIIGVTCHASLALAKQASDEGASYVAFGRFFPSATKPHAESAPPSLIFEAKRCLSIPVVAIGGITHENMQPLLSAGADSLAVCQGLFAAPDIQAMAAALTAAAAGHQTNPTKVTIL